MKKRIIMLMAISALLGAAYNAAAADSLVVFRPTTVTWLGSHTQPDPVYLNGVTTTSIGWGFSWVEPNQVPLIGDVNGDGIDDIAFVQRYCGVGFCGVYHWVAGHSTASGGVGSFSSAATSTITGNTAWGANSGFGAVGSKCFLADINGDGYADAINVGSDYGWLAMLSTSAGLTNNGTYQGPATINRYAGYVVPRPNGGIQVGDFDGNGEADICFVCYWDGTNARWLIKKTSGGVIGAGAQVDGFFGLNNDTFLVGDINGDGRDDGIVVRNWDGTNLWWSVQYAASDGTINGTVDPIHTEYGYIGNTSAFFGRVGDIPFVADINGDGRKDICVSRLDNINWEMYRYASFTKSDGTLRNAPYGFADTNDVQSFGSNGDVPLVGKLGTAPAVSAENCVYYLDGDFNSDCKVNFGDFAVFAKNWLIDCVNANPGNPPCDY